MSFKCLFSHDWKRYDRLVEQLFVGGYYAWLRCQKCKKIKFASCEKYGPVEDDINDN